MSIEHFLESLAWRYAVKLFDENKKVPRETLFQLLDAARLSASSYGLQPWKFFVVEDNAIREELRGHSWNQPQITQCSALVVIASKSVTTAQDIESFISTLSQERHQPIDSLKGYKDILLSSLPNLSAEWAARQTYIALGHLLAASAIARVDSCPMEGFDPQAYDRILNLPSFGYNARVLCALGYRDVRDKYADAKKVRWSMDDVVKFLEK